MSEEADRRIEEARKAAQRQKDTAEFLSSLTKNDELVKRIINPETWAMRDKARAAADRGEYPRKDCAHPFAYVEQYVDEDPSVTRKGLPTNLFECTMCGTLLWLVDPYGQVKSDG